MFRKTAAPQGNKSQKNNAAVSTKAGAAYDLVPAGRDASETTFAVFTASLQQFVFFFLWFGIQKKKLPPHPTMHSHCKGMHVTIGSCSPSTSCLAHRPAMAWNKNVDGGKVMARHNDKGVFHTP